MTGFLCALGGVCLQQRSTPGPATYSPPMGPMSERKHSMVSMGPCDVSNPVASASSCSSSASCETPVSRFLDRLLALLVCGHDRVGLHVRTNVKDLLGMELSPALYPMLFNKLRNSIGKFFDTQGPVSGVPILQTHSFIFILVSKEMDLMSVVNSTFWWANINLIPNWSNEKISNPRIN